MILAFTIHATSAAVTGNWYLHLMSKELQAGVLAMAWLFAVRMTFLPQAARVSK